MDYEKKRIRKNIDERLAQLANRLPGRPLTVAVIGTVGVGKSSFINTMATSMSTGSWQEHAYTGHHGMRAEPVTAYTRRYPQCCRPEEHQNKLLPTLMDIGGLPDQLDEAWHKVLNLLFYGRIPEETSLLDVHDYLAAPEGALRWPRYQWTYRHLMVDRVVVVVSATEELPRNLIESVLEAARPIQGPSRRTIPIFGVMTKIDLVDPEVDENYKRHEQNFKDLLGLGGAENRFLRCINYCSAVDPDNERIRTSYPALDVPVLRLMTQICDPVLEVVHQGQRYPFNSFLKEPCVVFTILFFVIFAIFIWLFIR